jgi:hypothetical protein
LRFADKKRRNMKDNLYSRSITGYYAPRNIPAETAYTEAVAESSVVGRAQVDAWYGEQAAPVLAKLHEMAGAPAGVIEGPLSVDAMARVMNRPAAA